MLVVPIFIGATSLFSMPVDVDTSKVIVRMPSPNFRDNYTSKKEYIYSSPPKSTFPLAEFIKIIENQINRMISFFDDSYLSSILFLIGVLLFVLFVIKKSKMYGIFYTIDTISSPSFTLEGIQLDQIDFDLKIGLLIENQEYRQAVRFLFLKLIDRLKEKGHIQYSKEKTNFDYLNNLKNPEIKSQFLLASNIYNYVWYGETEIGNTQYRGFEQRFQTIYNLIDAEK